jgi:uncharacterized membrane protein
MKMSNVIARAKKIGINDAENMEKAELIRSIQTEEGNMPCFLTGVKECPQTRCCWREDCLGE